MLIGLDPLLSPDLLHILRAMGHGDDIVLADANFPAASNTARLVRLDGIPATDALRAILSVMPLDAHVDDPARSMQDIAAPDALPPVVQTFQEIIDTVANTPRPIVQVERFDFYARARAAYAIVQTGEGRHFGNLLLRKGALPPPVRGA